ncbi:MAG: hypothetical protein Q7T16_03085 [Candidatus Burarchaeum sp.]|nr:hypothetical protein [Candidatus Burarchaeum sp.]MDO8339617.1 hypothetical protein [Candidatus Burarchaeum sp.]
MPEVVQISPRQGVERPAALIVPVARPPELAAAQGLCNNIGAILQAPETVLPDENKAQVVSIMRAFESPRTSTGAVNPYFLNTHHLYEALMRVPGMGESLDTCKLLNGTIFEYEIGLCVQNGSMTRERGAQLKQENANLLAGVKDWGEYVAYQDWANRVFSRYGSSFVFSNPAQALLLTIMTQTSGTVRSEIGMLGQEIMRRKMNEASEREEEDEARQEAEGTGAESGRELDGFFTTNRRRKP